MLRKLLLLPLLVALIAAGCGNSAKKNNAPSVTPVAGNLVAHNASPSVAAPALGTPTVARSFAAAATRPPPSTGSPLAGAAATTPAAAAAPSASAAPTPAPTRTSAPSATSAPTAAATTAAASASATAAPAASAASGGPADPRTLIDAVKPGDGDLPSGFSAGQFSGYVANAQAVTGFADPQGVLDLLNSTGRQDGFVEQVNGPSGAFAISIQVWQDAAGAKTFFDQHPVPDSSVQFQQAQLDQPLGEQYQALLVGSGAQASYALSWRVGRVALGLGGAAGADGKPTAAMLQLADLLTKRAESAQQ